jgi:hypothetical protein
VRTNHSALSSQPPPQKQIVSIVTTEESIDHSQPQSSVVSPEHQSQINVQIHSSPYRTLTLNQADPLIEEVEQEIKPPIVQLYGKTLMPVLAERKAKEKVSFKVNLH